MLTKIAASGVDSRNSFWDAHRETEKEGKYLRKLEYHQE
jgi:hypothetical protein